MGIYKKDSLLVLKEKLRENSQYLHQLLRTRPMIRLEVKMAYLAIIEVLLEKPIYDDRGNVYLKKDNPQIRANLARIANKTVNKDKMAGYFKELENEGLIILDKQDIKVNKIDD